MVGAVTAGPASALLYGGARYGMRGIVIDDDTVTGWSNDRITPLVVLVVLSFALSVIGYLAAAWLVLHVHDDDVATLEAGVRAAPVTTSGEIDLAGRALRRALATVPRTIGWGLLGLAVMAITFGAAVGLAVVALPLGIILFLALIPLGFYASIKLAFVAQSLVDRSGDPFRRSATVSTGRFWAICGRVLLVGIVAGAANYGVGIATNLASGARPFSFGRTNRITVDSDGRLAPVRLDDFAPSVLQIVVGSVGAIATTVITTSVVAAALAQLYRTRVARP